MTIGLSKSGLELQINRGTAAAPAHGVGGAQTNPDVAALSNGSFIVAFQSVNEQSGDQDIYAQQITASGTYDDVQRDVAGFTPDQTLPSVAATANGGYITAWQGFSHSIQLEIFNPSTGTFSTPFTIRDTSATPFFYFDPTIATFANGNYVLTYGSERGATQNLEIDVVNPGGTALVKGIEVVDGAVFSPTVAAAGNTALIVYEADGADPIDPGFKEIKLEEIDSAGNILFTTQVLDTPHILGNSQVTGLADGRFVAVWSDATFGNLQGVIFDPVTHSVTGINFKLNPNATGPVMNDPHVAGTPDGGFIIAWDETGFARDSAHDVFMQRFDSRGQAVGPDIEVNSLTAGNQDLNSLAVSSDGHVLATWVDFNPSNPNSTDVNPGRIEGQLFTLPALPLPKNDFNSDGAGDILWHNDNGADSIWDSGQIGSAHIIVNPGDVLPTWHIAGAGDFDGNHHSDILWQNDNGALSIWDNGQIAGAHVIANPGDVPSSWHIADVADFDGNGHSDILWRNDNGALSIWDNGQIAGAHVIANPGDVPTTWHIVGTGDFDGNNQSDILWQNDNGALSIWDNGQISGAHIIASPGAVPTGWHVSGTGDFDGNGQDDILWRNDNGTVSIWDNGQISQARIIAGAGVVASSWHIAGTRDFDGNGQDDILWRNDNGAVSIWDNAQIGSAHIIAGAGAVSSSWHIV